MPVLSLYELSKMQLIRHIGMLTDIGDLPYSFLAPILRHIQAPSQLIELEENCPQVLGETAEIWLRFMKRDIAGFDEKQPHQPKDPKNWSKVYKKMLRDAETEKQEQENKLKEQMRALQKGRDGNRTLIVEGKTGYDPAMRKWGFGSRGTGGGGSSSSSWGDPAAPRKTGKVFIDKLRRGAYDTKLARPKATHMPSHLLQERKGVVREAPARLVRMTENAGPQKMAISKQASASVIARNGIPHPSIRRPITSRPVPQPEQSQSAPALDKKIQRASLPIGQHFTAPKLPTQNSDGLRQPKRRREVAPSLFHNTKKRKA